MFRPLLISGVLLGSFYANANTVEVASDLYSKRAEDTMNSKKAADIYKSLASSETDKVKKAQLMVEESKALYYFGTKQDNDSSRVEVFTNGHEVGLAASNLLEGDDANKSLRARALYFYGSNIGKWALAKGGLKPLTMFKKVLKPQMAKLIELDETVEEYGVYRILGLSHVKIDGIPFGGGSKETGLEFLERAFDKTIVETDDYAVATNSTTTRYLLFALMKNKKKNEFCELADNFYAFAESSREVQDAHNPKLIPETQDEVSGFLEPVEGTDQIELVNFYDSKC